MKKIVALLLMSLMLLGAFSCKSKKKCPAYSSIEKIELVTKS
jgi:hypothetical protein